MFSDSVVHAPAFGSSPPLLLLYKRSIQQRLPIMEPVMRSFNTHTARSFKVFFFFSKYNKRHIPPLAADGRWPFRSSAACALSPWQRRVQWWLTGRPADAGAPVITNLAGRTDRDDTRTRQAGLRRRVSRIAYVVYVLTL